VEADIGQWSQLGIEWVMVGALIYLLIGLVVGGAVWKRFQRSRMEASFTASYRDKHPVPFWFFIILLGICALTCVAYGLLVLLQVVPVGAGSH
jgi:hypothetical protein